jgi:hypothetical protein
LDKLGLVTVRYSDIEQGGPGAVEHCVLIVVVHAAFNELTAVVRVRNDGVGRARQCWLHRLLLSIARARLTLEQQASSLSYFRLHTCVLTIDQTAQAIEAEQKKA